MFYIPYDPKADPMYQLGQTLGLAGTYLAQNREARGAARMQDEEAYNSRIGDLRKTQGQIAGLLQNYDKMSDAERGIQLGLLRSKEGFEGINADNAKQYHQGITSRINELQGVMANNKNNRVHSEGYNPYFSYMEKNPFNIGTIQGVV